MSTKPVSELKIGDKVTTKNGEVVKILRVGNGIYRGSKMIEWAGDWTCEDSRTVVEVIEGKKDNESL